MICRSLPLVSLLSFFSSSRLSFSRRGEEELERCLRGDLATAGTHGSASREPQHCGPAAKGSGGRSCRQREPHLDRRRCGERDRVLLLSLSRDRVRSLRLLSRSREADRERRRSAGSGAGEEQSAVSGGEGRGRGGSGDGGEDGEERRMKRKSREQGPAAPSFSSLREGLGHIPGPRYPAALPGSPSPVPGRPQAPNPGSGPPSRSPVPLRSLPFPHRAAAASGTGCVPWHRPSAPLPSAAPPLPALRSVLSTFRPETAPQRFGSATKTFREGGNRAVPRLGQPLSASRSEKGSGLGPLRGWGPPAPSHGAIPPTPPHRILPWTLSARRPNAGFIYVQAGVTQRSQHRPAAQPHGHQPPRGLQASFSAVMVPQSLFFASSSAPSPALWLG